MYVFTGSDTPEFDGVGRNVKLAPKDHSGYILRLMNIQYSRLVPLTTTCFKQEYFSVCTKVTAHVLTVFLSITLTTKQL